MVCGEWSGAAVSCWGFVLGFSSCQLAVPMQGPERGFSNSYPVPHEVCIRPFNPLLQRIGSRSSKAP